LKKDAFLFISSFSLFVTLKSNGKRDENFKQFFELTVKKKNKEKSSD
jgi:hypothetical protein